VPVFATEEAFDRAAEAASKDDPLGFAMNTAFFAPDRTKCRVLEYGWDKRKVRIYSGQFMGRTGWVLAESLKP